MEWPYHQRLQGDGRVLTCLIPKLLHAPHDSVPRFGLLVLSYGGRSVNDQGPGSCIEASVQSLHGPPKLAVVQDGSRAAGSNT